LQGAHAYRVRKRFDQSWVGDVIDHGHRLSSS
jgi:hypothetical protein